MIENISISGLIRSINAIRHSYNLGKKPEEYFNDKLKWEDIKLAHRLASSSLGSGHDGFLKGINVEFELKCSQYFDHELQRYSHIDIVSCQSVMHKMKELIVDAKSLKETEIRAKYFHPETDILVVRQTIGSLSAMDENEIKADVVRQCLPESLMLWKTINTNYLQLKTIYEQRKNHKLSEWHEFCDMIQRLPLAKYLLLSSSNNLKGVDEDEYRAVADLTKIFGFGDTLLLRSLD